MAKSPTAFVMAGGGSLGAIQVGMLAELVDEGVRPDLIAGVSAGALNGAFFAHDPSAAMVGKMASLWAGVTTRQIVGLSWGSLLGVLGLRGHLTDAGGLRAILEQCPLSAVREYGRAAARDRGRLDYRPGGRTDERPDY